MLRAATILPPSDKQAVNASATITLPREERYKRRVTMTADDGTAFLLDLPEAAYLAHGTGLLLDDGSVIRICAAEEPLLRITGPDRRTLARITWHIGNRHTPAEIAEDALFIQPDYVLAEMVRGLGGVVENVTRPFEPEGGAYGGHGALDRGHHHGHNHDENHTREH